MTSNIGTKKISPTSIGFDSPTEKRKDKISDMFDDIKKYFLPEFLNRIDEIIPFNSLSKKDLFSIIDIQMQDLKDNLKDKGNSLRLSKTAKEYLLKDGSHREWGARPLRRAIQNEIENKISNLFIKGKFKENALITVKSEKNKLLFTQFLKNKSKS